MKKRFNRRSRQWQNGPQLAERTLGKRKHIKGLSHVTFGTKKEHKWNDEEKDENWLNNILSKLPVQTVLGRLRKRVN
jgi:hypothetical protein